MMARSRNRFWRRALEMTECTFGERPDPSIYLAAQGCSL